MKKSLQILNAVFWLVFMTCCLLRNVRSPALKDIIRPGDKYVLSKAGFFHRGWGMFPSVTSGAHLRRLRYTFRDGSEVLHDYFPMRSNWYPSVWNEVMEDILVRDDNGDRVGYIKKGFFNYECIHAKTKNPKKYPLKSIAIETTSVPLHQQFTNYGRPYHKLDYRVKEFHECKKN